MTERQGHVHGLSEHELSEIRMLIEERTGICFDESRERFFSTRVREHLRTKGMERGTDLLRAKIRIVLSRQAHCVKERLCAPVSLRGTRVRPRRRENDDRTPGTCARAE